MKERQKWKVTYHKRKWLLTYFFLMGGPTCSKSHGRQGRWPPGKWACHKLDDADQSSSSFFFFVWIFVLTLLQTRCWECFTFLQQSLSIATGKLPFLLKLQWVLFISPDPSQRANGVDTKHKYSFLLCLPVPRAEWWRKREYKCTSIRIKGGTKDGLPTFQIQFSK